MLRVGEHIDAVWKFVRRTPEGEAARESMFGVRISEPKQPGSEKPRSSATMIRKLGRLLEEGANAMVAGVDRIENEANVVLAWDKAP